MTATFTAYLRRQTRRQGPVGDIAREVQEDPNWPEGVGDIDGLHDYLNTHTTYAPAHEALDMAWDEYQTESNRPESR